MERFLCIHGHFYQPPRENPWLEAIEAQDSAYPHHDWNERIAFECYAPNAASRILDAQDRIERIVSNYSRISFNFGPTLLAWMERHAPKTYNAVLEADRESRDRFSGHGSAIAQVYNHMILPLANGRDRRTQVLWGLRDFRARFGREPEGMWLAETAVDTASLEVLAAHGVRFTILAPSQALRTMKIGDRSWQEVSGGRVDPSMPYQVRLPSGATIAVFFYDGPVSRAVAFEGLLADGARFAERLLASFDDGRDRPQLVHIATDGETYGHHQKHGDMALAWALDHIESRGLATLTNYGEHLERHPPTHCAEIQEKTSWSCVHGVDRWWSDCGCASGAHPGWRQAWRTPLRDAMDGLRDGLASPYEQRAGRHLADPWAARDDYIDVVLARTPERVASFLEAHGAGGVDDAARVEVLKLLEMQRHLMLMYTSCGWFFDDLSGIETVQVMQYAGRAIQLARQVLEIDPEPAFLARLAEARSNLPEHGDGRSIYDGLVRPAGVDLPAVAAHFVISSLFEDYDDPAAIYCYTVELGDAHRHQEGKARLFVGRARFTSRVTGESDDLSFGVFHLGDHNVQAGVREYRGEESYTALVQEAAEAFGRGEFAQVVRVLDRHFQGVQFSLQSLFRDEQRRIVDALLGSTLADAEASLRGIYERHAPLLRFLGELGTPLPRALRTAAEFVLNTSLRRELEREPLDLDEVRRLLEEALRESVQLDASGLGYALERALERLLERLCGDPADPSLLQTAAEAAALLERAPLEVNLWRVQNLFYDLKRSAFQEMSARADDEARGWVEQFRALGGRLSVRVD